MTTYFVEVPEAIQVSQKGQDGPDGPSIDFELASGAVVGVLARLDGMVAERGIYPFNLGLVRIGGSLNQEIMQFQQESFVTQTSVPGMDGNALPLGAWHVAPLPPGPHTVRLEYICQATTATFRNRRLWVTIFD
jgi:hypothetical protein